MKRNQWILVGTAGVLSVGALGIGAMSVANAMSLHDAAGAPVAGVQLLGTEGSGVGDIPGAKTTVAVIVAPSPTDTPSATQPPAEIVPAPAAPQPLPAPAPVTPDHSGVSADSADSND